MLDQINFYIYPPHPESSSGQALTSPPKWWRGIPPSPFVRFRVGKFLKAVIPVKTGIHKTIENTEFQPSLE
jgi:hypothetical protein